MKVSDLIVYLQYMPPDAPVKYLCRTDHGCFEGDAIHVWKTSDGDVLISDEVGEIDEEGIELNPIQKTLGQLGLEFHRMPIHPELIQIPGGRYMRKKPRSFQERLDEEMEKRHSIKRIPGDPNQSG